MKVSTFSTACQFSIQFFQEFLGQEPYLYNFFKLLTLRRSLHFFQVLQKNQVMLFQKISLQEL